MRKKTIEEELKEIAEEKDNHIDKLHEEYLSSSDNHAFDFDNCERTKNNLRNNPATSNSDNNFTLEDYKRMVYLEERELSDEEFDEYCALCDRFSDANNKDELMDLYDKDEKSKETLQDSLSSIEKIKQQKIVSDPEKRMNEILAKYQDNAPEEESLDDANDIPENMKAEITRQTNRRNRSNSISAKLFLSFFFSVFVVAGLCVSILFGIKPWIKTSSYVATDATVISVYYYYDSDGDRMGRATYEYVIDGQKFERESSISQSPSLCPAVGETITIYVNPNNPLDVIDNKTSSILMTFMGMIFVLAGGIPLLVTWLKKR